MSYVCVSGDINFFTILMWIFTACNASVEICPTPPSNITVILIPWSPPSVLIEWGFDCSALLSFELTYRPIHTRYKIVHELDPYARSINLDHLIPGMRYEVYITAITKSGPNITSESILFKAPDVRTESDVEKNAPSIEVKNVLLREEEVIIVVIVLIVWIAVIVLFFNRWGKIRMLEPYQPDYRSDTSVLQKQTRTNITLSALDKSSHCFTSLPAYSIQNFRPRQNSVFVISPSNSNLIKQTAGIRRKIKSAEDIQSLVVKISCDETQSTAL